LTKMTVEKILFSIFFSPTSAAQSGTTMFLITKFKRILGTEKLMKIDNIEI